MRLQESFLSSPRKICHVAETRLTEGSFEECTFNSFSWRNFFLLFVSVLFHSPLLYSTLLAFQFRQLSAWLASGMNSEVDYVQRNYDNWRRDLHEKLSPSSLCSLAE
jgi:hypothetical protein